MKYFIAFLFIFFMNNMVMAQTEKPAENNFANPIIYDLVVSFNSICCGPASNEFLHNFIDSFNKKNKVIVPAWQLGGCGREGESKILISITNLKKATAIKFLKNIKKLIPAQNTKNKTINASSGEIALEQNIQRKDINNCRGALTSFYLTNQQNIK